MCLHMIPPSWDPGPPSHPPSSALGHHRASSWDPVLYNSSFPLAVCFTHGSVYVSLLLSQSVPHSPSLAVCPQVCLLHLGLCSCPANKSIHPIFLDSPYVHYSTIYTCQDTEAAKMSIDGWVDRANTHNGTLLSHWKKRNWVICRDADGPWVCHGCLAAQSCPTLRPCGR